MTHWSVGLVLADREARPITGTGILEVALADPAIHGVQVAGSSESDAEGPPRITFELEADDAQTAELLARSVADRMRRAANLEDTELPLAWVAPMEDGPSSSLRFLDEARDCLHSDLFDLAIVAAQIHFELQVRTMLRQAAQERNMEAWLATARNLGSLNNPQSQATVQLLLGTDVKQLPEWAEYLAHVGRRNEVVHQGRAFAEKDAEASIVAVRRMWVELTKAARRKRQ